jgi:hypothetical protein
MLVLDLLVGRGGRISTMQLSQASLKKIARSRVTNGSKLLGPGVDERSTWVRRCRDVINLHIADLGGPDNVTAAEQSIVRRAAVMTTALEMFEVRFAKAGEATAADLDLYSRTAANLRRLLESVGLKPRPGSSAALASASTSRR